MAIPDKQRDLDRLAEVFRSNIIAVKERCQAIVSDQSVEKIILAMERLTAAQKYFTDTQADPHITLDLIGAALADRYDYGDWANYSGNFLTLYQTKIPALLAAIDENQAAIFTAFTFDSTGKISQAGTLSTPARDALLILVNDILAEYD